MNRPQYFVLVLSLAAAGNASAQFYIWYDDNGTKHVSTVPRECITEDRTINVKCQLAGAGKAAAAPAAPQPVVAKAEGTECVTEHAGGLPQKIITYRSDGATYAINGQARQRAASRGWKDGGLRFTPEEMQQKLSEGLARCP